MHRSGALVKKPVPSNLKLIATPLDTIWFFSSRETLRFPSTFLSSGPNVRGGVISSSPASKQVSGYLVPCKPILDTKNILPKHKHNKGRFALCRWVGIACMIYTYTWWGSIIGKIFSTIFIFVKTRQSRLLCLGKYTYHKSSDMEKHKRKQYFKCSHYQDIS